MRTPSLICALALLTACGDKKAPEAPAAPTPDAELTAQVRSAMDASADPCEDFYRYSCGGWLDATEIPGDEAYWGRSFSEIDRANEELVKRLLEESVGAEEPEVAKVGSFYSACMDEASIDAAGLAPIEPWLAKVDNLSDADSLMTLVGELHGVSVDVLFSGGVYPDFKDSSMDILHTSQGGLGLPDREYYFRDTEDDQALRDGYLAHMVAMFELAGVDPKGAQIEANAVMAFETKLAEVSWPREKLRDPEQTYHKIDRSGLQELTPDLSWDSFFAAAGAEGLTHINVEVPDYYQGMEEVVTGAEEAALKSYLRWHIIKSFSNHLPTAFQDQNFAFYGQQLAGQKEQKARWRRCVDFTTSALGDAVGEMYVNEAFPGDSKEIALELIHGIEEAFGQNLASLDWMDDATRESALEKRGTLVNKIGYPDQWRDYSALNAGATHFDNVVASRGFEVQRQLAKVGNPVDRGEWYMPPQMVNAYYNPLANEMVFPAGILQPPFFDRSFPAAMNFGAIGMVMGHELTHGFDDTGRKFDAQGRMEEWWPADVVERFEAEAQCVVDQYGGYEVQEGVNVNGQLTLGENIADLGGLKQAYEAWKAHEAKSPATRHVDGLTQEQLFFVAFAQGWCAEVTPELEQLLVTVDTHSPPRYRVLGPVASTPAFGEAFECDKGSTMYPEDYCEVW